MKATIKEFTTGTKILEIDYERISINEGRLALMLSGGFNATANSIQSKKLVSISIETQDIPLELSGTTISYNFILSSTPLQSDLVICDNTLLIELNR